MARAGRFADAARLPGCLGGMPPSRAAPYDLTRRGAVAAITLFIFSRFIRAVSTSPFPPPGWRMHILATET